MKKKDKKQEDVLQQSTQEENVDDDNAVEVSEDDIEVNDPGDCIGHWAVCDECEMCEIQDSCKAMTEDINGDDEHAEKKQ